MRDEKEHILTEEQLSKMGFDSRMVSFNLRHLIPKEYKILILEKHDPRDNAAAIQFPKEDLDKLLANLGKDSFQPLWEALGKKISDTHQK